MAATSSASPSRSRRRSAASCASRASRDRVRRELNEARSSRTMGATSSSVASDIPTRSSVGVDGTVGAGSPADKPRARR